MTARTTTFSRFAGTAMTAGAILLALAGAAGARAHGGGFHHPIPHPTTTGPATTLAKPAQPANALLKSIPVKKPADMRPSSDPIMTPGSGMSRGSSNGLP